MTARTYTRLLRIGAALVIWYVLALVVAEQGAAPITVDYGSEQVQR